MEYMAYLELAWQYLPYMLCFYVFVTLVPKSFAKMKSFADADYEANRHKYHRCYGPELCCHALAPSNNNNNNNNNNTAITTSTTSKQKQRKPVTRVYPKKSTDTANVERRCSAASQHVIKRQVQPSAIQTFTHVTQIARMFETGNTPTTTVNPNVTLHGSPIAKMPSAARKFNRITPNAMLNDMLTGGSSQTDDEEFDYDEGVAGGRTTHKSNDWHSDALPAHPTHSPTPSPEPAAASANTALSGTAALQMRRSRPISIQYAGTSATPSTSSPLSSPLSSPTSASPVRQRGPYNLQTSLEDIFAAIARNAERNEQPGYGALACGLSSSSSGGGAGGSLLLSPVTSIDDILSQRRLSRPLSAYSISDLLVGEENEAYVENFLRTLNNKA